jgi:hypothetical protein
MYCVQQLYDAYLQIFFKWKSKCRTPINGYDLLLKDIRHPVRIYKWAVQHDLWCLNILIKPHAAIIWSVQKHTDNVKRMSDLAGEKPCISPRMFGWRKIKYCSGFDMKLGLSQACCSLNDDTNSNLDVFPLHPGTDKHLCPFICSKWKSFSFICCYPLENCLVVLIPCSFIPWNFHLNGTTILVFIHLRILPGQVLTFSLGQWCLAICFLNMQPSCFVDIFFWGKLTQYQMNCNLGVSLLEWFL